MLTNFKKINEDIAALEPLIQAAQDFINNEVKDSNAAFLANLKNTIRQATTLIQQKRDYIAQETAKHKAEYENIKNTLEHLINLFNSIGTKSIELTNVEFWRINEGILSNENLGKLNNTGDKLVELAKKTKELGDDKYEKLALEELEPLISKARTLWWLKKAQGLEFSLSHAHQLPSSVVTANITSIGHEHDRYDFVVEKMTYNDLKGYVNIRVKYWFKIYGDTLTETRDYRIKTTIKYEAFEFKNPRLREDVYDYEAMKRDFEIDNSYENLKKYFIWDNGNDKLDYEEFFVKKVEENDITLIRKVSIPNSDNLDSQTFKTAETNIKIHTTIKDKISKNRSVWIEDNINAFISGWELKRTNAQPTALTINDVEFKPGTLNLIPHLEVRANFISPNSFDGTLKINFSIHDKVTNSNQIKFSKVFGGLMPAKPRFDFRYNFSNYFIIMINKYRSFGDAFKNLNGNNPNLTIDDNFFKKQYKLIWNTKDSKISPLFTNLKIESIKFSQDRHGLIFDYKVRTKFIVGRKSARSGDFEYAWKEIQVQNDFQDFSLLAKVTHFLNMLNWNILGAQQGVWPIELYLALPSHPGIRGYLGDFNFSDTRITKDNLHYKNFWNFWPSFKSHQSKTIQLVLKHFNNNDGFFEKFYRNPDTLKSFLNEWHGLKNSIRNLIKAIWLAVPNKREPGVGSRFEAEEKRWKSSAYVVPTGHADPDKFFKNHVVFIGENEDQSSNDYTDKTKH
ncbi:hypothetical protein OF364_00620 [Mycoplasma enhydrae]|uniref:hypothetical protein n=1 Tax=Mycoplasma enhydrae TaxID=2499220 RepID=UPI0021E7FBFB|nr:hypothetical protein [Mycoplasma enhydrae]MCV3753322.1 hypothetical protein [Mycoplasma enhydrae]